MFTRLRIKNFKSWKDTRDIRLAPLTVFFGTNSSGKSSINQFLLMLKQTAESPDRKRVLHSGDAKTAIDLGTYPEMVHGHLEDELISLDMEWGLPKKMDVDDVRSKARFTGTRLGFKAELGPPGGGRKDVVVHQMSYQLGELPAAGLEVGMARKDEPKKNDYELTCKNYNPIRNPGRAWPLPPPVKFYGFPDEVTAYYQNADFVRDLTLAFERCLQNLYYLGPLRQHPQRTYTWSGEIPDHVGWSGDRAIDAILSARERRISRGKRMVSQQFEAVIARWLKEMGLIDAFEVRQIGRRRDYEVIVKTANVQQEVNVTDVGFGVSQVMPVLVQCFYAPAGSTIIIEQPEIHLHPSVQAILADLFIEVIHAREGGSDRAVQLLVESHSEHFLRRLQRRIAEEHINPDETAIYFCQGNLSGSQLMPLDVDLYGNIQNWPANFFGDEVGDLARMTEAAMKRQMGG